MQSLPCQPAPRPCPARDCPRSAPRCSRDKRERESALVLVNMMSFPPVSPPPTPKWAQGRGSSAPGPACPPPIRPCFPLSRSPPLSGVCLLIGVAAWRFVQPSFSAHVDSQSRLKMRMGLGHPARGFAGLAIGRPASHGLALPGGSDPAGFAGSAGSAGLRCSPTAPCWLLVGRLDIEFHAN